MRKNVFWDYGVHKDYVVQVLKYFFCYPIACQFVKKNKDRVKWYQPMSSRRKFHFWFELCSRGSVLLSLQIPFWSDSLPFTIFESFLIIASEFYFFNGPRDKRTTLCFNLSYCVVSVVDHDARELMYFIYCYFSKAKIIILLNLKIKEPCAGVRYIT